MLRLCPYLKLAILKSPDSSLPWYRCPGKGSAFNLLYHLSWGDIRISLHFVTLNYPLTWLLFTFYYSLFVE